MVEWRREISLQVVNDISWVSTANKWIINFFNTRREIPYLQATM